MSRKLSDFMKGKRQMGKPKTDYERLINHFGKDKADKMIKQLGEKEAYKKLPIRGSNLK